MKDRPVTSATSENYYENCPFSSRFESGILTRRTQRTRISKNGCPPSQRDLLPMCQILDSPLPASTGDRDRRPNDRGLRLRVRGNFRFSSRFARTVRQFPEELRSNGNGKPSRRSCGIADPKFPLGCSCAECPSSPRTP